jgi:hypothetical protein
VSTNADRDKFEREADFSLSAAGIYFRTKFIKKPQNWLPYTKGIYPDGLGKGKVITYHVCSRDHSDPEP